MRSEQYKAISDNSTIAGDQMIRVPLALRDCFYFKF